MWTTNPQIRQLSSSLDVPNFKADATIYPIIEVAVALLQARNGGDSVFILTDKVLAEQTLHGLILNANIRVMVLYRFGRKEIDMLLKLRPIPQFFTVVASTGDMNDIFQLVSRESDWKHQSILKLFYRQLKTVWLVSKIVGFCCFLIRFKATSSTRTRTRMCRKSSLKMTFIANGFLRWQARIAIGRKGHFRWQHSVITL